MEPEREIPSTVNGQINNFEVTCTHDKTNPDGEKIKMELICRNTNASYEGSYSYEGFTHLTAQHDSLQEIYEQMYESITKKDEYLKISPEGTIQVGYYFLRKK